MKKVYSLLLFLIMALAVRASIIPAEKVPQDTSTSLPAFHNKINLYTTGKFHVRKICQSRFRGKLSFWMAKHWSPCKRLAKPTKDKGQTAFVLSWIGLVGLIIPFVGLFSLPLAIIGIIMGYSALKADPLNKKAKTAILLGWITIVILVLVTFIALLVILLPVGI